MPLYYEEIRLPPLQEAALFCFGRYTYETDCSLYIQSYMVIVKLTLSVNKYLLTINEEFGKRGYRARKEAYEVMMLIFMGNDK